MSKIGDLEQQMIACGMSDADFEAYKLLLRRVPSACLKRQHCYITALRFLPENAEQSVRLIRYGLEAFEDGWFSTYESYRCLGKVYERSGDYPKACAAYLQARDALGDHRDDYQSYSALELLWMRLHADGFVYSPAAEEYYLCAQEQEAFSKALVNHEFKLAVASIIIALHHGRREEARAAYEQACAIAQPDYVGKNQPVLTKHRYRDKLHATPESLRFLHSIGEAF